MISDLFKHAASARWHVRRQVFGGHVSFSFFLTAMAVNCAARANGLDHSWTKQIPEASQLTGESLRTVNVERIKPFANKVGL